MFLPAASSSASRASLVRLLRSSACRHLETLDLEWNCRLEGVFDGGAFACLPRLDDLWIRFCYDWDLQRLQRACGHRVVVEVPDGGCGNPVRVRLSCSIPAALDFHIVPMEK